METCFFATKVLRSSRRYGALDETAVFGCACRHEFPWLYINLKHGERLVQRYIGSEFIFFSMLCGCWRNWHSVFLRR